MSRGLIAEIDLSALRSNFQQIVHLSPKTRVCAIVKANAYGHGMETVARVLRGADAFGVTSIEEGLKLMSSGIKQPILLLEGVFSVDDLILANKYQFHLVIHCFEQLKLLDSWLACTKQKNPLTIWLKLDSGMGRLGFSPADYLAAFQQILTLPLIDSYLQELVIMTHLSCADDVSSDKTGQQLLVFEKVLAMIAGQKRPGTFKLTHSIANSAAFLQYPNTHFEWVRPGLMLYGASPVLQKKADDFYLKPVMTLKSKIISIKQLSAGDTVGYGSSYKVKKSMLVGIVAVGYGDGYPRAMATGAPVLVKNQCVSLIGRVSMDMIAIDLSLVSDVCIGDPVILWGKGLPVERVAEFANTISYELFCNIAQRVPLHYIEEINDNG